jgi:hypothetical protein
MLMRAVRGEGDIDASRITPRDIVRHAQQLDVAA